MKTIQNQIEEILRKQAIVDVRVQTLGNFRVWLKEDLISSKTWGRDKTIQLFQFFITARHRRGLHKEQIVSRLWEDASSKSGDRDFKVALHGINKALEPNRMARTEPRFIVRQGITYQINQAAIFIDAEAMEQLITLGNQALNEAPDMSIKAYQAALSFQEGIYLPNRLYEDWSSAERERLQVLVLGTIITLGELLVEINPLESIRLAQQALLIDNAWEDAYRLQMLAYFGKGNRPMAIKTYQKCVAILDEEFGIEPLPETKRLFQKICGVS